MNKYNLLLFALVSLLLFPSPSKPTKTPDPVEFDFPTFEEMPKTHLPCHRMKRAIEHHAKTYHIPKHILYGIAYEESRYEGPHQTEYNHAVENGGAYGPMQVTTPTARIVNSDKPTPHKLTHDLEYNVHTSAKILHLLHNLYGNWKKALGAYNTGKPVVNDYAVRVYNYKPSI